ILTLGGIPAYSIVFAFIPFVNFYFLYLHIMAVHRIGARFGRGAGMTVMGVLLPPLWATLVGAGDPVASAPLAQRVAGYAPQQAGGAAPAGPVIAPPLSGIPVPPAPSAPAAPAAFTPPAPPAPPA